MCSHSLSHSGQSRLSPDSRSRLGTRGPMSPPHRKSSHLSVYWKEVQGDSTSAQMDDRVSHWLTQGRVCLCLCRGDQGGTQRGPPRETRGSDPSQGRSFSSFPQSPPGSALRNEALPAMHNSRCPKRCEESLFHLVMVIQNVGDLEGSKVSKEGLP